MKSAKTLPRIAGSLYLLASLLFVFAIYARSSVKGGGASQLADHIRASAVLFRAGVTSDLVSGALFLATAMALYLLLRDVDRTVAAAMVVLVAVLVTVAYLNDANELTALSVASNPDYASAFGTHGTNALVMLLLQAEGNGLAINELFWGLWLIPLSYLVLKSKQFPAVIGALLAVAAANWIFQFVVDVLTPGIPYPFAIAQIGGAGEIVFVAWLLVVGVRQPARDAGAAGQAMPA